MKLGRFIESVEVVKRGLAVKVGRIAAAAVAAAAAAA